MRSALRHPFGLALLIPSLLLSGLMRFLPGLERWSAEALWVLLLGLLAYAASVASLWRWRPGPPDSPGPLVISSTGLPAADVGAEQQSPQDFALLVQEALRCLNNPAALSRCELLRRLPGTLSANRSQLSEYGPAGEPTPLEKAQALRDVLTGAIERLNPSGESIGASSPQALQYHIIHEAYVQRRPTSYVITRHSISESTFHRNRREAISALARDLAAQEDHMARQQQQR
jgi:hypothetical protein